MDDNVDILHDIIENAGSGKVPSDCHGEKIPIFCSTGFHLVGFGLGPPRPGDLDPTLEEKVYDVCVHKTCGARNENMTEKGDFSVRACQTCGIWYSPRNK